MEPLYKPDGVEARWQRTWEDEGLYRAGAGRRRDETFVICVPPPNVTGALHMGHALNGSIQDVLIRWHRMQGFDTLWQPGYDHAGISTQNVVEKQLAKEGTSRKELGREAFVERVWRHLEETGRTIMRQFRSLGASLDYERERFTMDDAYIEAVMRFFVHLWDRGWIYRANRIVNWCPFHETAISDLEVAHEDMDDTLTYARYPFADGSGHLTIATVRPATMLADVAVAVHPDDERYRDAVGKEVARPVRRARRAGDRGRARRAGVRDRRAEGHAGPRPDGLRDRPRPRSPDDHRDRPRRAHERERRRPRREDAGGSRPGDSRVAEGARPAREARALPACGRHLRALPHADRAARLAAVVGGDGGAAQAGARGAARAARPLPPRVAAPVRDPLARGDPGLEHLAPALVGAPAAALVLPGRPRHVCLADRPTRAPSAARPRSSATPTCSTPGSRRRSGRTRRSAGRSRRPSSSATTPATSTRPRARSSASGRTG